MTDDHDLSDFDRQIIGASRRITIPLGDAFMLRDVADYLRGLALQLDIASRTSDQPLRSRLMTVRFEIDATNKKIKARAKQAGLEVREGRRPKSETAEQSKDEAETVAIDHFRKSQHLG